MKKIFAKFYTKYKLVIFPGMVVLSCIVLILFVIFPQISKLISNSQVEKELKNKSQVLEVKATTLEGYDKNNLSKQVEISLFSYPAEKDFAQVVGILQGITLQSGFNMLSLVLGQSTSGKYSNSESYSVKMELIGPKNLYDSLLKSIENSSRIMRVDSMDITASRDSSSINASLVVEVLFSSLPKSFGTIDSPLPTLTDKDEELITKLAGVTQTSSQVPVILVPKGKANPFE